MRRILVLAGLLVSGCTTYVDSGPGYAYPAYSHGYAVYSYPAYTYRPRVYAPPRYRAWGPWGHRRHYHGDRWWRD